MFALRMLAGGRTEGQTLLITPKRSGLHGALFNKAVLWLTAQVGNYFAKGDTQIFETIRFNLKTPTRADQSILQFAYHVEQQPALTWETWVPYLKAEGGSQKAEREDLIRSQGSSFSVSPGS
jgi:hypothetical protein